MSQRDVKHRIASVKNIHKITRAMEMVAAARLRRAEQRIAALRPYARRDPPDDPAGRRRPPAARSPRMPILAEREDVEARRRSCSSPATAASPARSTRRSSAPGTRASRRGARGRAGRRVLRASAAAASRRCTFRSCELAGSYTGFTDRPGLRQRARDRRGPHHRLRRRARSTGSSSSTTATSRRSTQEVRRETLLPLQQATISRRGRPRPRTRTISTSAEAGSARSSSTSPTRTRSCSG